MSSSCVCTNKKLLQFSALLVHKPTGITSHTLTRRVSRLIGATKAGHTGTLDRAAEGLMILLLGKATRFSRFFLALNKQYHAVFALGKETTTLDCEGQVSKVLAPPSEEAFTEAFNAYKGEIAQRPPIYSAVHVDGVRAWRRAKTEPTLELKPRNITIYDSSLLSFNAAQRRVTCTFTVSSGTYIRSIVRDITHACNSCGHLVALKRTDIAQVTLEDAATLCDIESNDYQAALVPVDMLLRQVKNIDVVHSDDDRVRAGLAHGISPHIVKTRAPSDTPLMLYDRAGFLGMWEFAHGVWKTVVHMGTSA